MVYAVHLYGYNISCKQIYLINIFLTDGEDIEVLSSQTGPKEIQVLTVPSSDGDDDTYLQPSKYIAKTTTDDKSVIREYHIRKVKNVIDKCYRRKLRFPKKYVDISQRLGLNTNMVSDREIEELQSECLEALSMAGKTETSSSGSGESADEARRSKTRKLKKKSPSRILPSDTSYSSNSSYNVQYSLPVEQTVHRSRSVQRGASRQHPYHMHSHHVSRYSHYDNPPPPPPNVQMYGSEEYDYYPHQRSYSQPPVSTYGDTRMSSQYEMQYMERSSSPYAEEEYAPLPSHHSVNRNIHQQRQSTPVRHMQVTPKIPFVVDPARHMEPVSNRHHQVEHERHMQAHPKMSFTVNPQRHMQSTPPSRQVQRFTEHQFCADSSQQSTQRGIQTSPEMYMSQENTQRKTSPSPQHYSKQFGSSQNLPSFHTLATLKTSTGEQTPVHISTPSSPHSEPLYSDTSLTPELTSQENKNTQVITKNYINL